MAKYIFTLVVITSTCVLEVIYVTLHTLHHDKQQQDLNQGHPGELAATTVNTAKPVPGLQVLCGLNVKTKRKKNNLNCFHPLSSIGQCNLDMNFTPKQYFHCG